MTFGWRIGKAAGQRQQQALFESLVDDHATRLFGLAYRLCGDRELAEELVQETFFQAWKSMDRLRDEARAQAWLMAILRHCYSRAMRERARHRAAHEALATDENAGQVHEADPATDLAERDALQRALDRLDDRYKVVFLLVNVGGLTCEAAATELNLPLGTVLSRMHRARRQLRQWLEAPNAQPVSHARTEADDVGPTLRLGGKA